MGKPETDLALRIRKKTLELLLEKEPEEISTRDIARACGVSATSIYYYYKDKETLFTELKIFCIREMEEFISGQISIKMSKWRRQGGIDGTIAEARAGLEAFRDWAFANPRMAHLVMGRLKADTSNDSEKMANYYRSTLFAKSILDRAVKEGLSSSKDTMLDANLCIAAVWGAIESVLLKRTIPKYWTRRKGLDFTNSMIDMLLAQLILKKNQSGKRKTY